MGAFTLADMLPHLREVAVAVEVLTGVFVDESVAVVVVRADGRSVGLRRVEVHVVPVGIVDRADVDGLVAQHLRDLGVVGVGDEVMGEPERTLGGRRLPGVPIALEIGGRLVRRVPGGLVGDRQLVDRLAGQ